MTRDALPKQTPVWVVRLLLAVEVDLERAARDSVPGGRTVEEEDEWMSYHRTEAHGRLRAVLYGPEDADGKPERGPAVRAR